MLAAKCCAMSLTGAVWLNSVVVSTEAARRRMIAHEIKNMNEYSNSERSYGSGGVVPSAAPGGAVRLVKMAKKDNK